MSAKLIEALLVNKHFDVWMMSDVFIQNRQLFYFFNEFKKSCKFIIFFQNKFDLYLCCYMSAPHLNVTYDCSTILH